MSKGAGQIESRIVELFAATPDRALSVADIADHAFALGGRTATRAQRLSETTAAHRLLRRIKESRGRASQLIDEAHRGEGKADCQDYGGTSCLSPLRLRSSRQSAAPTISGRW
jgi:hypothetical protein